MLFPVAFFFALSAVIVLITEQETAQDGTSAQFFAASQLLAEPATRQVEGDESRGDTNVESTGADWETVEQAPPAPAPGSRSATCDDPLVLVDRSHSLPADYAPGDLAPLSSYGVSTLGGELLLRRKAAEDLRAMVSAASADGMELIVASAYRSYDEQEVSHARLSDVYGKSAMSAPPGHSQHQLGTAVDLTNAQAGYEVTEYFGETGAYAWLSEHADDYGFVLAYPPDGEAETGYGWEPWHYRHIGVDGVERLSRSGLGLQAFLSAEGVVPRC